MRWSCTGCNNSGEANQTHERAIFTYFPDSKVVSRKFWSVQSCMISKSAEKIRLTEKFFEPHNTLLFFIQLRKAVSRILKNKFPCSLILIIGKERTTNFMHTCSGIGTIISLSISTSISCYVIKWQGWKGNNCCCANNRFLNLLDKAFQHEHNPGCDVLTCMAIFFQLDCS